MEFYEEDSWLSIILDQAMMWIIALLIVIAMIIIILCIPRTKYHYEYVDLDNNSGIAKECSYKFEDIMRGGQGSPVCEIEDEIVKQVKEYTYIYDGKYKPIDEILKEMGFKK